MVALAERPRCPLRGTAGLCDEESHREKIGGIFPKLIYHIGWTGAECAPGISGARGLNGMSKTTVVVGAGIVGAAIAFELQRRGRHVTLVDRDQPGLGASFGNMASIAVSEFMAVSRPATWRKIPRWLLDPEGPVWLRPSYAPKMAPWFLRFILAGRPSRVAAIEAAGASLCARVLDDLKPMLDAIGARDMLTDEGCLAIYETEAEFAADRDHITLMENYGFAHQVLTGKAIRDLEPALSSHIAKAVLLPANRSIRDPYRLVLKFVDAFRQAGGIVLSGAVERVEGRTGGADVVLAGGTRLAASDVILAAGVRTRSLAALLGEPIPLETERGYHTQIMAPGISMCHSIIWPERAFMVTPTAGGIRVGGNVELAGLDALPDYRRARVLVRHAQRALPGLKAEEASEWMGHRPAFPDTLPIMSASSRVPGVWYATGHGHLGLTYSATTARLIADMVTGAQPPVDMAPFSITRF